MINPIFQGSSISVESPVTINGEVLNFGTLYNVANGKNGAITVSMGVATLTDSTANAFTAGMVGNLLHIPSDPQGTFTIASYVSASAVTLSTIPTVATGLTWFLDTNLSNLALGKVTATCQFCNATTWIDNNGTTHNFTAGQTAVTADTLTTISNVPCYLSTDQSTPVFTIIEGLPGLPATSGGIKFQITVLFEKIISSVLQAPRIEAVYYITIFQPLVSESL